MGWLAGRDSGRAGFKPNEAFLYGASCVLIAAFLNLLPFALALRGTPGGRAEALAENKREAIRELEEKIAELRAGEVLQRGRREPGRSARKGYERRPVAGGDLVSRLGRLRRARERLRNELESRTLEVEQEELREEVAGRYQALQGVHWPAIRLLALCGREVRFTDRELLDAGGRRRLLSLWLFLAWMPLAFLVGGLLAFLSWPREAIRDYRACRRESRILVWSFLGVDALWLGSFLAISLVENLQGRPRSSPAMTFLYSSLWAVKLFQLYLVLRGCMALRVAPRRTLAMGSLAGTVLVYWIPLLMIYEDFSHTLGLILARRRKDLEARERKRMKAEEEAE